MLPASSRAVDDVRFSVRVDDVVLLFSLVDDVTVTMLPARDDDVMIVYPSSSLLSSKRKIASDRLQSEIATLIENMSM